MAVCDAKYRFTFIDVGSYGHNNDSGIYGSSDLGIMLEEGSIDLPPPSRLPGTDVISPYVFVGDGAFPLKNYMMKPYTGGTTKLTPEQDIFNYRLSRARRVSLCHFQSYHTSI